MFVHDSLHTGRNIRFELRTVWPTLQRGDLALVDDVDDRAFRDFVREVGDPPSIVLRSADGPCMFGTISKGRSGEQKVTIPRPPLVPQEAHSEAYPGLSGRPSADSGTPRVRGWERLGARGVGAAEPQDRVDGPVGPAAVHQILSSGGAAATATAVEGGAAQAAGIWHPNTRSSG